MISAWQAGRRTPSVRLLGAMALCVLFAACASAPVAPTAALTAAELAIQRAESDDAGRFAATELDRARKSLARANQAVARDDMVLARRAADEAAVTARLASARSEAIKAEAINDEMKRSAEAMREELRRAGGGQ